MERKTKNLIMMITALVLIGGLAGLYIWQDNRPVEEPEEISLATPSIILIDRPEDEITSVRFTAPGHDLTLIPIVNEEGNTRWAMEEAPDAQIDQFMAREMIRSAGYLSVENKILDSVDNPADYGIGTHINARAAYTDGSSITIYVGNLTPSHERYYLMLEGDPALYSLFTYFGNRYLNTANSLIERDTPQIIIDGAEYLLIHERGSRIIEFAFDGDEDEKEEMYERFGMVNITMTSPYPGRDLYYTNMENNIFSRFNERFRLGDLAALMPGDLSEFGLDEPSLEFKWISQYAMDELHLLFGDRTDDGMIYCKFYDRPQVFLVEFDSVSTLFNINLFQSGIIERFIALIDIMTVEHIVIEDSANPNRDFIIDINHRVMPEDEGGWEYIEPTVNGIGVEESPLKLVYRLLIGLTSDVEIEPFEPTVTPDFTVTFIRPEEGDVRITYYEYETHFYAMSRDGGPCIFLTSRQAVEIFFNALENLIR
jgi:hypothetical protein